MENAACSDEEFIALFSQLGATQTARHLGVSERRVYERRRALENRYDRPIHAPSKAPTEHHPERQHLTVEDGVVIVFSDAHYWPGYVSTAHRGLVAACKHLKPKVVIANGDVFDGASISRFSPSQWEDSPTVQDEIETCKERLGEVHKAAKGAKFVWTLGNHDARFEARLASVAPEFANVHGMHLKDHFAADWMPCWSCWINEDVVIKHRYKGGIHATHNNAMWSGKTMVTGHLHSLKVTPFNDYNGIRWGIDTGTLSDPFGPQFRTYMEDNPRNWRSGFAVLTFKNGKLLWPQLAYVSEPGIIDFCGEQFEV